MIYINSDQVHSLLTVEETIRLSEAAYLIQSSDSLVQPLRNIVNGESNGIMGTMPVFIKEGKYKGFGVKSVSVKFNRENHSKPSHMGAILVYDEPEESSFSIVDAGAVTEVRTAAATAVATDILADPKASKLAIIGTGVQARAHLKSIASVRPIKSVWVWGRSKSKVIDFMEWAKNTMNIDVSPKETPSLAVQNAEIICTTTSSNEAILQNSDLPEGVHVNAIGASALGFRELDEKIYKDSLLFTDCNKAVLAASSSVNDAVKKGYLVSPNIGTEIGSLISKKWVRPKKVTTVFKSVGLAVQDVVIARYLIRKYLKILSS
ncbi:ornithine cyclodeaminase family protein [Endozoicomonas sp. SM1973]|uniref:Ornithine cyclodeaminase family protein n=1 Tax=Spartinivicinus marinus TaxID=2994442 RepID=A0A853IED6_9GAMM|nr:ornithine cyclodeaminase family protein [Spartinivicinus marinus]MCX4027521.1 ornithine cyclodeaminase family protein [Spartinivicinus marinus]NYZ68898.1 ornithine cyclodeaminase family protein [Spartinivicinus marinus]